MNVKEILSAVEAGTMSSESAFALIKNERTADMGYARLDLDRLHRTGKHEVVFCEGKQTHFLVEIYKKLYQATGEVLGTRANVQQYHAVAAELPEITFDALSGILKIEKKDKKLSGSIVICTGGTSDIAVSEEAAQTCEFFGHNVTRLYDVGVAGIHRLLDNIDTLRQGNVVICIAGMEGALPSVVAGLVDAPVIAVPTSVGYGANLGGMAALLSMLNSCANGVSVVNIDNGFGAAFNAVRIDELAERGHDEK